MKAFIISLAGCNLDLVFVVDTSDYDPQTSEFNNLQNGLVDFCQRIDQTFQIARNGTHVALVTYSDRANINFNLNQYYDLNGVISGIRYMQPANNFISNTAEGLNQAIVEYQARTRPNPTRRIVVHVTNSRFDNTQQAVLNANRLKALYTPYNPCVYPVAILPDVDLDESRQIATDPATVLAVTSSQVSSFYSQMQSYLMRCYCTAGAGD